MKKKIIVWIAVVAMGILLLRGCGSHRLRAYLGANRRNDRGMGPGGKRDWKLHNAFGPAVTCYAYPCQSGTCPGTTKQVK